MKKKILITGGHVTPALAIIDAIHETMKSWEIVFVGRKFVNDRESSYSFEYNEVIKRDVRFIHLEAGRLTRIASFRSFFNILKIPHGLLDAWHILSRESPDVILSFGGYLALPIACVAYLRGIPVYTHEQTIHPGIANRIIGYISKKVFISFEESGRYFNSDKVIYSGNPIRKQLYQKDSKIAVLPDLPCIYVTGGSMGAHSLNVHIEHILPEILKSFVVIHQTGNVKEFGDFDRLLRLKQTLDPQLSERYFPYEHILDEEIGWVYDTCEFVVSRAGANTFFELVALKKPAIFVPLPWSAHDEQARQANLFKKYGTGEVFDQNQDSSVLCSMIRDMHVHIQTYRSGFAHIPIHTNIHAIDIILTEIFTEK